MKPPVIGPRNPLYKTRMCRNIEGSGSCPYGPRCQFAHSEDELERWVAQHKWERKTRRFRYASEEKEKEKEETATNARTFDNVSWLVGGPFLRACAATL